jgi:hypothetical protein
MRVPWHFFRAGSVERGPKYEWRDAYSRVLNGHMCYPWDTKREAQTDARANGGKAVFHKTKSTAIKAESDQAQGKEGEK